VLPPSRAKDAQILARFHREARLAAKLKHPHVVRSFQVGESNGVHYLVMEYLEGEPLDEVIARRKRLPPGEAVRLIHHALLGLQHLHEMGLVHRDLKPANLMLVPAPARGGKESTLHSDVKILDIGLAREFFDENAPVDAKDELTGEGVLLGTPDYLAPEQARDPRNIDIRADIYSLGCTLYHLLAGHPPFRDKNILNQMIRHATETPKPLGELVPNLPEGLTQIVNWMMAKKPDERYPTPARAAQALDAFMMVVSAPKAVETPQMRKYLTWLEMAEPGGPVSTPTPTLSPPEKPAPVAPAAKPASSSSIPVAKSDNKARKRSEPPAAPLALGPAPTVSAPVPSMPHAVPTDQIDVELIQMPEAPPQKGFRPTKRDALMIGVGSLVMLLLVGFCTLATFVIRWVSGN
jgi:eukaryotic-like serine/threonine-protein kinase